MLNRLDQEFPQTPWRAVPPIGPDGVQPYMEHARHMRAEAFAYGLRRAARALVVAFRAAARLLCYAGYGAAKRPPQGSYATTAQGRLTGGCA